MTKRLMQKWVKALRSGEYRQGAGNLKLIDSEGRMCFCCLGVLATEENCRLSKVGNSWNTFSGCGILTESQSKRVGLSFGAQQKLAEMNDSGQSFKRIATFIEKNYKKFATWGEKK